MACSGSAVPTLGGRAFWKEFFEQEGPQARERFALDVAADRVRQVDEIFKRGARPWFARYGLTIEQLHGMRTVEKWLFRYGEGRAAAGTGGGPVEGDVY